MSRKLLFFDIDGTLWNWKNEIPDSTREAVRRARQKGHLAFINTGRTRGFITNRELLGIGFDGIVSGCGTMIEYEGRVVYDSEIDRDLAVRIVEGVRRYGCRPILEGKQYLYMDDAEFAEDWYGQKLKKELGEHLRTIEGDWGRWEIQKLSCATTGADLEGCMKEFGDILDFIKHDLDVCEMVPLGHSKGTGIEKVCELTGMDISDTVAFGDSMNDRTMLETAALGIVMGSGSEAAKKLADHVTSPQEEGGIWDACLHFGFI